jgi:hypothetical protein
MQERAKRLANAVVLTVADMPSSTSTSARSGWPGIGIRGRRLLFSRSSLFGSHRQPFSCLEQPAPAPSQTGHRSLPRPMAEFQRTEEGQRCLIH